MGKLSEPSLPANVCVIGQVLQCGTQTAVKICDPAPCRVSLFALVAVYSIYSLDLDEAGTIFPARKYTPRRRRPRAPAAVRLPTLPSRLPRAVRRLGKQREARQARGRGGRLSPGRLPPARRRPPVATSDRDRRRPGAGCPAPRSAEKEVSCGHAGDSAGLFTWPMAMLSAEERRGGQDGAPPRRLFSIHDPSTRPGR